MSAKAAKPRTRAYKPKTKTGCKTCKIRRVKCDEVKPHCRRCTTTGRTCDGYIIETTLRTSPCGQTPSTSPSLSPPSQEVVVDFATEIHSFNAPSFLLPLLRLESDEERNSLQFYIKHAGPALAQSSNSAFWQRQVLQAAHQHASVQHCIIALGAMYRRFFESTPYIDEDIAGQRYQFALNQSNKAIQRLIQDQTENTRAGVDDKLTAMTCCVLFGSMANLQRQQSASLGHLRSGIRMLKETKMLSYEERDSHPVNINSLRSIFTGLDIQARSSMNWSDIQTWEPVIPSLRASEPVDTDTSSPWALSELHCRIETLLNDTLAFNRGCVVRPFTDRKSVQNEHNALVTRFRHITQSLDTLRARAPSIDSPQQNSSKTLLLLAQTQHWLRSSIAPLQQHFHVTSPLSALPYDAAQHFTNMMPHIEYLLSLTLPSVPVYSAAPGPLSALWIIGTSAPTACVALRRKALDLMLKHPRQEGLFEGRLMGRIGMVAWGLEQSAARREMGLAEYAEGSEDLVVPEHLRLVFMDVQHARDDERSATVKLANAVDLRSGGGTIVTIKY